ncbi:hypothetical protein [Microvirga zambiensis]|uniref:hypothetical protein n=1 Tax=Microvirga zambiensis TaxID=1402137 RepID=UPI00191D69B4|nr:hypothetical protein [Microvirga zambiensis]
MQRESWITLRQSQEYKYRDGSEEFVGISSLAIPSTSRAAADKLTWDQLGLDHHAPEVGPENYVSSDVHENWGGDPIGVRLVLDQRREDGGPDVWHLHQDLVIALGLVKEGSVWLRPDEGWYEVAKLELDEESEPRRMLIRAEFLGDYLAARSMALYLSSYRSRSVCTEDRPSFAWPPGGLRRNAGRDRLEADILNEEDLGGGTMVVFSARRTDLDQHDDNPVLEFPNDASVETDVRVVSGSRGGGYQVLAQLWRTEWFDPPGRSVRVRGDKELSGVSFAIDASGARETSENLKSGPLRWLWFDPAVVRSLLSGRRGAVLNWLTRDTGIVGATRHGVHFGVNPLGFINVLAKDIGHLPAWEQRVWSTYSVVPEGGVSDELLASQVRASPAVTIAPEARLPDALSGLENTFMERTGRRLLRDHATAERLLRSIHRFRAADADGIFALAKDAFRLFAERIDVSQLDAVVPPPKKERQGSLKSLQRVIASVIPESDAYSLMSPFFGIADLRQVDAHLGSSDLEAAFRNAKVDQHAKPTVQGLQLVQSFVEGLEAATESIKRLAAAT